MHFGLRLGASALYKYSFKLHCMHAPFILFYVSNLSFAGYVAWQEVLAVKHNNWVKHSSPTLSTHPLRIMHKPCALTYQAQNPYCYISGTNLCSYISGSKPVPLHIRHKPCALGHKSCALTYRAQNLCPHIALSCS